ncbi:MAG: GNAT family N-acetyltransferase [Geminicoccales bacterium]
MTSQHQSHDITVKEGYMPSLIGRIVEMHARYYSRTVGFGAIFESKVAGGLADFIPRLERPGSAIWSLEDQEKILGSIAIDGEGAGRDVAKLRWFLIDDAVRGQGFGQALMDKALTFCDDQAFDAVELSTFKGLDAARRLYERHGFVLTSEQPGDQWGPVMLEQTFRRDRRRSPLSKG